MLKQCKRGKITHRDGANNTYLYYIPTCKHVWNMIILHQDKIIIFWIKIGGIQVAGLHWTSKPPQVDQQAPKPPQKITNGYVNIGEERIVINYDIIGVVGCMEEWGWLQEVTNGPKGKQTLQYNAQTRTPNQPRSMFKEWENPRGTKGH